MYSEGSGALTSVSTGAVSTAAGITILPNTGGNPLMIAMGLISLVAGALILGSFAYTRIASILYRK